MSETQSDKKYNETVTRFFDQPAFAAKALGKEDENNAFVSESLDAAALKVLQSAKIGDQLVLKRSPKLNSRGRSTFFLEKFTPKTATEALEEL
jgi:hypothetical protein